MKKYMLLASFALILSACGGQGSPSNQESQDVSSSVTDDSSTHLESTSEVDSSSSQDSFDELAEV